MLLLSLYLCSIFAQSLRLFLQVAELSPVQLFVGGLCWEGPGPYPGHVAFPASPGVSCDCLCSLLASPTYGDVCGVTPAQPCGLSLLPPECTSAHSPLLLAAFSRISRRGLLLTPSCNETRLHTCASLLFFLTACAQLHKKKREMTTSVPPRQPPDCTGAQSAPHNSAERLHSASALHPIITHRK